MVKNVLQNLAVKISLSSDDYSEIFQKLLSAIDNLDVDNPKLPKLVKDFNALLSSLVENQDGASDERTEDVKLSLEELDEFNRTWTRFKRKGLGDSLVAFRNALALGQLSDNALDDGLTLSTVHTMKGLEKDIVFLIGMCEGVFPTTEQIPQRRWMRRGITHLLLLQELRDGCMFLILNKE